MEEISLIRKKVHDLNKRREAVIDWVLNTKPYIAAQVYQRYKKCGNPNCKCARGELHGPFMWIYQKKKGQKVISTTITKGKTIEAEEMAKRYSKYLSFRQEIREIDQKINELLNELEPLLEREVSEYVKRKEKAGE